MILLYIFVQHNHDFIFYQDFGYTILLSNTLCNTTQAQFCCVAQGIVQQNLDSEKDIQR